MRYVRTRRFKQDFKGLPSEVRVKAKEKWKLFRDNPSHPSLRIHPIVGQKNPTIYEGYIDLHHRFTFHREPGAIIFRRIGRHSVIEEEARP